MGDNIKHGAINSYLKLKCRCDICKKTHTEWKRGQRKKWLKEGACTACHGPKTNKDSVYANCFNCRLKNIEQQKKGKI